MPTPARFAAAVEATLSDSNVDAVLVLHVPRPAHGGHRRSASRRRRREAFAKPVLAAWLGALERLEAAGALEAGGIANFYTPEMRSTRSRSSRPTVTIRSGCWRCRRRSPSRTRRISISWSACAPMRARRPAHRADGHGDAHASHDVLAARGAGGIGRHAGRSARRRAPAALSGDAPLQRERGSIADGVARTPARRSDADARVGRHGRRAGERSAGAKPSSWPRSTYSTRARTIGIGIFTDAVFGPVITFGATGAGRGDRCRGRRCRRSICVSHWT